MVTKLGFPTRIFNSERRSLLGGLFAIISCGFAKGASADDRDVSSGVSKWREELADLVLTGGGEIQIPRGHHLIQETIVIRGSDVTIAGVGFGTILEMTGEGALFRICKESGGRVLNVSLSSLVLTAGSSGRNDLCGGIAAERCSYLKLSDIKFLGFGRPSVHLVEVWDSRIRNCEFRDAMNPTCLGMVVLESGPYDNCNQVHFGGCIFETYRCPAFRATGRTWERGMINEIVISECKFESIHPVEHLVLEYFTSSSISNTFFTSARAPVGSRPALTLRRARNVSFMADHFEFIGEGVSGFFLESHDIVGVSMVACNFTSDAYEKAVPFLNRRGVSVVGSSVNGRALR